MRKIVAGFVLIFCFTLFITGYNKELMSVTSKWMYSDIGNFQSDKYRYGDLYGLCYLSDFRIEKKEVKLASIHSVGIRNDVALSILGDSYTYSFIDEKSKNFERVNTYQFIAWDDRYKMQLPADHKEDKKVLLIEIVERNAFAKLNLKELLKTVRFNENHAAQKEQIPFTISTNLEFLLFEHHFLSWIKEWKADFLKTYFGKVTPEVSIAKNDKYLYLTETLAGETLGNSFYPMDEKNYIEFENRLNAINDFFVKKGFDEVWLCIAPNPVRILNTEGKTPNKMFEYLTNSKTLRLKFLNLLPELSRKSENNFYKSDSHWNANGATIYRDLINKELLKIENK